MPILCKLITIIMISLSAISEDRSKTEEKIKTLHELEIWKSGASLYIKCKKVFYSNCGLSLYECEDGKNYFCMQNVISKKDLYGE